MEAIKHCFAGDKSAGTKVVLRSQSQAVAQSPWAKAEVDKKPLKIIERSFRSMPIATMFLVVIVVFLIGFRSASISTIVKKKIEDLQSPAAGGDGAATMIVDTDAIITHHIHSRDREDANIHAKNSPSELPPDQWICTSEDTCRAQHLEAIRLESIVKNRCNFDSFSSKRFDRSVCFFHIPKCGGTAIEGTLKAFYHPEKLKISKHLLNESVAHLPFDVWDSKIDDKCALNVLFRDPISKAKSLYSYIMGHFKTYYQFSPPPDSLLDDPFWKKSYYMYRLKRSPLEWFTDPFIKVIAI